MRKPDLPDGTRAEGQPMTKKHAFLHHRNDGNDGERKWQRESARIYWVFSQVIFGHSYRAHSRIGNQTRIESVRDE